MDRLPNLRQQEKAQLCTHLPYAELMATAMAACLRRSASSQLLFTTLLSLMALQDTHSLLAALTDVQHSIISL